MRTGASISPGSCPAASASGSPSRGRWSNEPAIVWADEPTGDLDSETADDIVNLIEELNGINNQTFVIVTHSEEVGQRAHRIVRMRDGRIERDGASPGTAAE